jgi:hypothetical protein
MRLQLDPITALKKDSSSQEALRLRIVPCNTGPKAENPIAKGRHYRLIQSARGSLSNVAAVKRVHIWQLTGDGETSTSRLLGETEGFLLLNQRPLTCFCCLYLGRLSPRY